MAEPKEYKKKGSGSYGCFVSPALTCKTDNKEGEVSKVFTMADEGKSFKADLGFNKQINRILLRAGLNQKKID